MSFRLHLPEDAALQMQAAPAPVREALEEHLGAYREFASLSQPDDVLWRELVDPLTGQLRCRVQGWDVFFEVEWAARRLVVTRVVRAPIAGLRSA